MRYVAFCLVLILLVLGAMQLTARKSDTPYHHSYFSQAAFFDTAYSGAPAAPPLPTPPHGILVSHHLLAKGFIAQAFNTLDRIPGKPTVVLLSPNHFDVGNGQITTSDYSWQTPYGVLEVNSQVVARLSGMERVRIDPRPFAKEHGISSIVPFIKKTLPDATVVPIMFKSTLTLAAVQEFADELADKLPANSIVITSVDMSHYVGEDIALPQDEQTIAALNQGDIQQVWESKTDSPAAMVVMMALMQKKGLKFNLLQRSSSLLLTDTTDPTLNTSYITGYWN